MGLRKQIAGEAIGRVLLGSRARFNEHREDTQEDKIILGRTAVRLLDYQPADEATGTPAHVTGNRKHPDKEGVQSDLRGALIQDRDDSSRGLGIGARIKTNFMAKRINKGISRQAKTARPSQESFHKVNRPISRFRPFKGWGQREARRLVRDDLANGTITPQQARMRRNFLKHGTNANGDSGIYAEHHNTVSDLRLFQEKLRNDNIQVFKGYRLANRRNFQNRSRFGLSSETHKMRRGRQYSRMSTRAESRQHNTGLRAERLRARIDNSHTETERLKTQLAHRRGRTYTPSRQFVHGDSINPRTRS